MGRLSIELVFVLRLVLSAVTVTGERWLAEERTRPVELPDGECARIVGARLRPVKICHALEAKDGIAPHGKLVVTLVIAPTGQVTDVRLDGAVGTVRFSDCVRSRARAWQFPRYRFGGPTKQFSFPVVFLAEQTP